MERRAHKEIELSVRAGGVADALGRILSAVAGCGVNVLAYCTYTDRQDTVVLLVTDNATRAKDAIEADGFQVRANAVVMVGASDHVGAAALLGGYLGQAGIRILYSYASSSKRDRFHAVFKTVDDDAAIRVLDRTLGEMQAA